jgi:hypothetical protein
MAKRLPIDHPKRKHFAVTELANVLKTTTIATARWLEDRKIYAARSFTFPSGRRRVQYGRDAYRAVVAHRAEKDFLKATAGTPCVIPAEPAQTLIVPTNAPEGTEVHTKLGGPDAPYRTAPENAPIGYTVVAVRLRQLSDRMTSIETMQQKILDTLTAMQQSGFSAFDFEPEPTAIPGPGTGTGNGTTGREHW